MALLYDDLQEYRSLVWCFRPYSIIMNVNGKEQAGVILADSQFLVIDSLKLLLNPKATGLSGLQSMP